METYVIILVKTAAFWFVVAIGYAAFRGWWDKQG